MHLSKDCSESSANELRDTQSNSYSQGLSLVVGSALKVVEVLNYFSL